MVPAPGAHQLMSRKVQRVDLGLGQIMSARNVALVLGLREARQRANQFLIPGPRQDSAEMLARLVRRTAGIRSLLSHRPLVDPIQEVANLLAAQLLDRDATAPSLPFLEGGTVLHSRSMRWCYRAQVLRDGDL